MDISTANEPGVVIIGGGQAGLQVADSLRAGGYTGPVTVVADETVQPYQRPPLSKDYLSAGADPAPLPLRGESFFAEQNITLLTGAVATGIDRERQTVQLAVGGYLPYTHLVLATGAANRKLNCDGARLAGVHGLRTLDDAQRLNAALGTAKRAVVIGAGFIGLEFAASARARGLEVTVLEFAPRPMGRALSPAMSDWFTMAHRNLGVRLRLGEGVAAIDGRHGAVAAVVSTSGERYDADLVVYGIGVAPNTVLAEAAGLEVDNGIVVDAALRTADPAILAVGDCASFPNAHTGTRTRLESVQNATDHGRHAARTITGDVTAYSEAPWFWSTQGPLRLQIAGISAPGDETVMRGTPDTGKFSVFCFRDGQLTAVESVNSPSDHMAARRLIASALPLTLRQAADPEFDVKAHSKTVTATA